MNSSIWPIDGTVVGTTHLSQSGPESNGNEGVFHISQSSRTEVSLSDSLVSYPKHLVGEGRSYPPAEMQSAYSTASSDWAGF